MADAAEPKGRRGPRKGRNCVVCRDPRLTQIHAAIDGAIPGEPRMTINAAAVHFEIPKTTLKRHCATHRGPLPHLPPVQSVLGHRDDAAGCAVCRHPQRTELDRKLLTGDLVSVWREYVGSETNRRKDGRAISRQNLRKHRDECLRAYLVECSHRIAEGITGVARAKCMELVTRLEALVQGLQELSSDGVPTGKRLEDFLKAVREFRGAVELLGRLTGELRPDFSVNMILASPDFGRVRKALVDALAPFGAEVLEAAATALEGLDAHRTDRPVLVVPSSAESPAA